MILFHLFRIVLCLQKRKKKEKKSKSVHSGYNQNRKSSTFFFCFFRLCFNRRKVDLHMLIKQKSLSLSRNLVLGTFGKLSLVFSTRLNLLYLLYSTVRRCCLLHLIKQNYLLRTLILITQVSLYQIFLLELIWNCLIIL